MRLALAISIFIFCFIADGAWAINSTKPPPPLDPKLYRIDGNFLELPTGFTGLEPSALYRNSERDRFLELAKDEWNLTKSPNGDQVFTLTEKEKDQLIQLWHLGENVKHEDLSAEIIFSKDAARGTNRLVYHSQAPEGKKDARLYVVDFAANGQLALVTHCREDFMSRASEKKDRTFCVTADRNVCRAVEGLERGDFTKKFADCSFFMDQLNEVATVATGALSGEHRELVKKNGFEASLRPAEDRNILYLSQTFNELQDICGRHGVYNTHFTSTPLNELGKDVKAAAKGQAK